MARPSTLAERVRDAAVASFVGRARELEWVQTCLLDEAIPLLFLHGIGGVGKSALLAALGARLEQRGVRVVRLDGRDVEPTPTGFIEALGDAWGEPLSSVEAMGRALADRGTIVLSIDEYDALWLIDGWIRTELAPTLPENCRVVFCGRNRPVSVWTSRPGWDALVRTLQIDPLETDDARRFLQRLGVSQEHMEPVLSAGAGHPLSLELAARAIASRPDLPLHEVESRRVLDELVARFLAHVSDPRDRGIVEAASLLRRVTRPLLADMLEDGDAQGFENLRRLDFVESSADGLIVHQSVRTAVERVLRAVDPRRHHELRARAWSHLRSELERGSSERRWRSVADALYLVEQPSIREAFFPTDEFRVSFEPAGPDDADAVLDTARVISGPAEAERLRAWWEHDPAHFRVARAADGSIAGFHVLAFADEIDADLARRDPVLEQWRAHLAEHPTLEGRRSLLNRRALDVVHGDGRSDVRAASWLDIKRAYVSHLETGRIYLASSNLDAHPVLTKLGFVHRPSMTVGDPDAVVHTFILDFVGGILGWLAGLIDAQYARPVPCIELDEQTRELVVDRARKRLTPLEFGVLRHLRERSGSVVARDELIDRVWGQKQAGSNVVDAVIRALRKKLGARSAAIETVTGFGYRFVPPEAEPGTG